MPSQGPKSPGTLSSLIGPEPSWVSPGNAASSDNVYATMDLVPNADYTVVKIRLVKGGTIQGDNKAASEVLPGTDTILSKGSATDLWGLTLTASDVNATDFGFVYRVAADIGGESEDLSATNFGFTIPSGATIKGVIAEVEHSNVALIAQVDHMRVTVHYTEADPGAAQGFNNPALVVDDDDTGTVIWTQPNDAREEDGVHFAIGLLTDSGSVFDDEVRLAKGGFISGNDKATDTAISDSAFEERLYGGAADLWGLTFTPADINAADFGFAVAYRKASGQKTHYLHASDFGFSIPVGATILGVIARVVARKASGNQEAVLVDHMALKVFYSGGGDVLAQTRRRTFWEQHPGGDAWGY